MSSLRPKSQPPGADEQQNGFGSAMLFFEVMKNPPASHMPD